MFALVSRPGWLLILCIAMLAVTTGEIVAETKIRRVELEEGMVAVLDEEHHISIDALPLPGEGLLAFTRRLCGSDEFSAQIIELNGGRKRLLKGVRYRVPYELLAASLKQRAVVVLFPEDEAAREGWRHRVGGGAESGMSLWRIAEWFTGEGALYKEIRKANEMADDQIAPGQKIVIPARLLRPVFRAALPVEAITAPPAADSPYHLEYDGEQALYRLQPGEALYSSVVVRFTGRVFAEDVNALAAELAAHNGIRDVTDIPVGFRVKVPFDLLLPEFLPPGHARRKEYEEGLSRSAQFSNQTKTRDLQGITVLLDAGHGGRDVGASKGGVWESLYVYDIMLRIRRLLESRTAAKVVPTTRDGDTFRVEDRDVLPYSRGHRVLTSPSYLIEDSKVGVNLRWYLANSVYRRARREGGGRDQTIFVSLHADSLHASLRGLMVYIPGLIKRQSSYGKTGSIYAKRKEFKEAPRVTFSKDDLVRSEGLSRDLAKNIVSAFSAKGIAVHSKPIRDRVIRNRREWVPAVLRYNSVPAKVLVEVCNLANDADRKALTTRRHRELLAEAVVQGILDYYGENGRAATDKVARK